MPTLSRRRAHHTINAWPGWVDALSSLIMVIIFLLVVFVVAQFYLAHALTGRDQALQRLNQRISELSVLLRIERQSNTDLSNNASQLSDQLQNTLQTRERLSGELSAARQEKDRLNAELTLARRDGERTATALRQTDARLEDAYKTIAADREKIELQLRDQASLEADLKALRELREKMEGDVAALSALSTGLREQLANLDSQLVAAFLLRDTLTEQLKLTDEQRQHSLGEIVALRGQMEASSVERARLVDQLRLTDEQRKQLLDQLAALRRQREADAVERGKLADQFRLTEEQRRQLLEQLVVLRKQVETGAADRTQLTEQLRLSDEQRRQLLSQISSLRAELETSQGRQAALGEEVRLTAEQRKLLLDQLAGLRDRSQALEARLASESERTMLSQKEIDKRDVRIKELLTVIDQTRSQLSGEQELTSREHAEVAQLSQQIASLREQLARLAKALELAELSNSEQKIQLDDLGRRLNLALASKVEELGRYRSEFFGRLRDTLGSRQDIRIVGDRFVFQSEVLFGSGSATLEDAGRVQLARLAVTLIDIARKIPPGVNWILRVDGHTDRRGIANAQFPSNWELSTARAISVVKALIEQGIPAERLGATGFGEFQPLDPGSGEEALARNRRIELKFDQR